MKRTMISFAAAAACLTTSLSAQAVDIDAGDYTAAPAGTNLGLLYYQHATRSKLYAAGNNVSDNAKLTTDIGIARGVFFMDIGGYIADPQFLIPFGKLKAGGDVASLGSNSGVGDPILAATVWFNKPGEKENFGITPFLWVPIGQYDKNDPLSLGENRWKFALQAAWIKPLTSNVTMDLAADVTFFGSNDKFGASEQTMKQKAQTQFQAFLRYHLSPTSDLRFGLSQLSGGETKVDGVNQGDRASTSKFQIGGSTFVAPKTQLIATYGRDISVHNGFKEDNRINLRLLQIF